MLLTYLDMSICLVVRIIQSICGSGEAKFNFASGQNPIAMGKEDRVDFLEATDCEHLQPRSVRLY